MATTDWPWRWFEERVLCWRIALLYLWLAGCGVLAAPHTAHEACVIALLALLYLVALRLWDDLADLAHDRLHHPQRVLVRHGGGKPFSVVVVLLLALLVGLLYWHAGNLRGAWLLAALLILAVSYLGSARWRAARTWRQAVVLLKYPLFVLLVAGHPFAPVSLLLAALAWLPPLVTEARSEGRPVLLSSLALALLAVVGRWLLPG